MAVAYAKKGKTLKKNGEKRMARTDGQECLCFPLKRKKKEWMARTGREGQREKVGENNMV